MNLKNCLNGLILVGAAFFAAVTSVTAQGTFSASTATGTKPRISIDGVNVVAADHVFVQILVNGAPTIDPFQLTLGGVNAGLFSKGIITVPGKPGGSTVDITIRAWDGDAGFSFDAALLVKATTTLHSFVLGGVVDANGIAGLPTPIVPAFTGFDLAAYGPPNCLPICPEPSTYVLAALGLGGLLFLRRR